MTRTQPSSYALPQLPLLASNVVCCSQPLAAHAGLRMLQNGGNAVDAAVAAAATLTVVEPIMNGIGGDLYAIVWDGKALHGLNATGFAPGAWQPSHFKGHTSMPMTGWNSVTVPGQVGGWSALSARFGKLPFAQLFEPAIGYADNGFPVSPFVASVWPELAALVQDQPGFAETFLPQGRAPRAGEIFRSAGHARTLQEIARTQGESFYRGALAEQLIDFSNATGGCLTREDLEAYRAQWVPPLSRTYRGVTLHEMPPNGVGIAALMALGILENFDIAAAGLDSADTYHLQIEAMRLAFADLYAHVATPTAMRLSSAELLDADYLAARARTIDLRRTGAPAPGQPRMGGTVYLTAADASGMMVSLIQSNYWAFGSGLVVPGAGISLHNRGANFSLQPGHPNEVAPHKAPMHTIIPGFITRDGQPLMSFGVMGGAMQAQGHLQMVSRLADFGQGAQSMCDAPRFMVAPADGIVHLESHAPAGLAGTLAQRGHNVSVLPTGHLTFGSSQLIECYGDGYVAVSDPRRDGRAAGF
jgi:gamma-glutamyltranspeptidase/glutathione hydrolase